MQFQDPNAPRAMDDLIEATGASSVQYPDKLECCGGPVMGIREQVTWSTGIGKVENARRYADILVTSCPFCYITYEKSQLMAESNPNLPVVHLPQLLGLAMGITEDDLGLSANKIDAGVLPARQEA
jgi:heterodisulfide reductase subunit B